MQISSHYISCLDSGRMSTVTNMVITVTFPAEHFVQGAALPGEAYERGVKHCCYSDGAGVLPPKISMNFLFRFEQVFWHTALKDGHRENIEFG